MHSVVRSSRPKGLKECCDKYTPGWIKHHKQGIGSKPRDSHWRKFQDYLKIDFSGLCGYCESGCKGEVDHFRPKSLFPHLVYEWSNWVFSCHDCNNFKGEKWAGSGFIDPCAMNKSARPEDFFDFDIQTGEIIPKVGLGRTRWIKARGMIDALKLNAFHHLRSRLTWISLVAEVLKGTMTDDPGHIIFIRRISTRTQQFSSITRYFLSQQGYSLDGN